jgi:hypothetical protein
VNKYGVGILEAALYPKPKENFSMYYHLQKLEEVHNFLFVP